MKPQDIKQELLENINKDIELIESQITMIESCSSIERLNTICMFENGMTIDFDDNKKPIITNQIFAAQFEPANAKNICEATSNGLGEHPKPVSPIEYYNKRLSLAIEIKGFANMFA